MRALAPAQSRVSTVQKQTLEAVLGRAALRMRAVNAPAPYGGRSSLGVPETWGPFLISHWSAAFERRVRSG